MGKHLRPVLLAAAALVALMSPLFAWSQAKFPTKPIRILVPFGAGSQSDILARAIGQKMAENWGQQVVVDNRGSAGGVVASQLLVGASPDGHTLMLHSSGHAISASLYSKLPYDVRKDFAAVSQVALGSSVLVVSKDLGVKSMKELIALAKANPGKLSYGTAGVGSAAHIHGEMLGMDAGIKITHIGYKGPVDALNDTVAGRITFTLLGPGVAAPLVREGRVLALGISTAARSPMLPDVPTIAETGLAGHEYDVWFGLFAPARTPTAVVAQISREVARILQLPDVRDRFLALGSVPRSSTPDEFDAYVRAEIEKLGKVMRAAGVRID
jgi:tripartite-type tricarboxylate transporter receptor subunit TctC